MAIKSLPSQERLRQLLDYDPDTGLLVWKARPLEDFDNSWRAASRTFAMWNKKYAGKEAFTCVHSSGYKTGNLEGISYRSHRLIWKLVTGEDPELIDHINGDRADNRFANLRSVDPVENARNMGMNSTNTSGHTGVFYRKDYGVWIAYIKVRGKSLNLGRFSEKADAVAARAAAEKKFGFHENHGLKRGADLTATIAALGAGETEDWPQDTTEQHKPARRAQRGAEG